MSLVLQVNIKIKAENVDSFMKMVLENGAAARKEPGCRQFEVLVDEAWYPSVNLGLAFPSIRIPPHLARLEGVALTG